MNRSITAIAAALLAAVAGLLPAAGAMAQSSFPDRPLKLVVPFPPGGTSDITGRILADALSRELGQPVVVDNKGGAGGTIGARFVAEAKPDGYTLLLGTSSTNGTNSAVYKNLSYDAVKSFTPITRIVTVPGVISASRRASRRRTTRSSAPCWPRRRASFPMPRPATAAPPTWRWSTTSR